MAVAQSLPPGPSAPVVMQTLAWQTRPIPYMERLRERFGKTFTFRLLGQDPFVMMADPDDIKAIFTAPPEVLHPGEGNVILLPIVGPNSILLLDEGRHMTQRKLMLPAFHGQKMEALRDVVTETAEAEIDSWPTDAPIAIHPHMQSLTLEVILRAVFGVGAGPRHDAMRVHMNEMLDFAMSPLSTFPRLETIARFHPRVARFLRSRELANAEIQGLIEDRRAAAARDGGIGDGDDVLSIMLQARHEDGSPISDAELRDELMTLLVAGHETTATELSWSFERLVRHPRVLSHLVSEIDAGDAEGGDEYLTATIRETLRRRPVLSLSGPRKVVSEIEIGGRTYGPGCSVVPNTYLVQHDPEIYPEPYEFRPERFLEQDPGTYTWTPFGGGRRRCLGASFAMLEMNIVLKSVLSRLELRAVGDGRLEAHRRRMITVVPEHGAQVELSARAMTEKSPQKSASEEAAAIAST